MNWKRGLLRVYVVLWVLVAIAGAFVAWSTMDYPLRQHSELEAFLVRHKDRITFSDLKTKTKEELADSVWAEVADPFARWTVGAEPPPDLKVDFLNKSPLDDAQEIAKGPSVPAQFATTWATWLGLCGLLPAALLWVVVWIAKGFANSGK